MYKTYKAKYLGAGVWEYNQKKKYLFTTGYIPLSPNTDYYILVDDEGIIISIVDV